VAAAVVLRSGAQTTAAELKAFLRKQLAPSKVPQQILMMSAFPRGATGKVSRSQLSMATTIQVELFEPPVDPLEIQIADIWRRVLKRIDIGMDEDFFKAGGDSLQAVQVLLEIESLTGQHIPETELASALTIRDLVAVVMRGTPKSDEIVSCAKQGSGTPYFFCHGDFSTRGFYARKLADLLEGDQPVFLLQPYRDFEGGAQITIEKMAQAYLPQLLKIHPKGCFRLGGFCNGGLLAWELAHQLDKTGREVEFVVLCDTISLNARPLIRAYARILEWISYISPETISNEIRLDWMSKLWRRMSVTLDQKNRIFRPELYVVRGAIKRIYRAVIQKQSTVDDREIISNPDDHLVYYRAMANYIPPKIRSMVFCMLCEQSRNTKKFSASAWEHLARKVQVEYVAGAHLTCITTHIGEFANITNKLLRRTSSAQSRQRSGSSHHVAPQS
jgi:thioesterase domain-containing protein/acyl carrier protein